MSCLCRLAALLACVALAVISFAMRLSTEFVNNLVAVLNVLASQVATALDTLNFALAADPTRTRTRPVHTSSTWYIPALSPPREARRETLGGNPGQRPETLVGRFPPPRPLAPNVARNDRAPGHASPTTPDSDSDGSVRPHPGASSFRPSPDLVNFYRNSLLPSAMNTSNHSLHGHRVGWMRWSGAKRTRTPGPPTRLSPVSFRNPARKPSRRGRSTSDLRLAVR